MYEAHLCRQQPHMMSSHDVVSGKKHWHVVPALAILWVEPDRLFVGTR